jgi:WD40 repeat protein
MNSTFWPLNLTNQWSFLTWMSYYVIFPNKNNFGTNNSKNIYVHIMLKTFISTLRQDYEFSWVIENQMLMLPSTSRDSTLWIWNKEKGKIGKTTTSHYHTNFTNIFQIYIRHTTFKNIIECLVATKWNIKKIVSYDNQMMQLPFKVKKKEFNVLKIK